MVKKIVGIFVCMLMVAGGTVIPVTGFEKINDNLDKKNVLKTEFEAEWKTYDTLSYSTNLHDDIYDHRLMGKLNQVMVLKKLCYDESKDYDWYSVDWTAECIPAYEFKLMGNMIDTDELCSNAILIDYGPHTDTEGTQTVSWEIGVDAGLNGAMVTASYSDEYYINNIQVSVLSNLSQNKASWSHASNGTTSTQTYKLGIVFRVPQNMPLNSTILCSHNSVLMIDYPNWLYDQEANWNEIYVGKNLPPAIPEPPIGPPTGRVDTTYEFSVLSADPEWSNVTYEILWGDGSSSKKTAESGIVTIMSHSWNSKGTYNIQVRAWDEKGEWDDWSQIKPISISRNKNKMTIDKEIFEIIQNMHPILKQLLQKLKSWY
jgi:hypothetical protein